MYCVKMYSYNTITKYKKLLVSKLCNDYHVIKKNIDKNVCVDDFKTELIRRLGYELSFGFLDEKYIINNTFLINHNRDEGHQQWIIYLVDTLLNNGVDIIEPNNFSSMTAKKIYLEKEQEKRLEEKKNYERLRHIIHNAIKIKDSEYCIPTYSLLVISKDEYELCDEIIRDILVSESRIKAGKYYDHFVKTYGYEELVEMSLSNLDDYIENYDMHNYIYFFKNKYHHNEYICSFIEEFNDICKNEYSDN